MLIKALVPLADGLEEIEAITIIDILRRAGVSVTTAALAKKRVHGSHAIDIIADESLMSLQEDKYNLIVLPGGMPGTKNLVKNTRILEIVKTLYSKQKLVAALCAAPLVLFRAGILESHKFTIHPSVANQIPLTPTSAPVVTDRNVITGQASGAALRFAFTIIRYLYGDEKVSVVNQGVLANL